MDNMLYNILLICGTFIIAAFPIWLTIKIVRGLLRTTVKPLNKPKKTKTLTKTR